MRHIFIFSLFWVYFSSLCFANTLPVISSSTTPIPQFGPLHILLSRETFALFTVLSIGLMAGKIRLFNVSLGSSGVIFAGLLLGHFQYTIPSGVGTLGLILFIYCIGIGAGPSFFSAFAKTGKELAVLSLCIISLGGITAYLFSGMLDIPIQLTVGIFAGALTSTPGLAAALDSTQAGDSLVSVGYGIAYPFGVIGVVLFVQVLPRLLSIDCATIGSSSRKEKKIVRLPVVVKNPMLFGKPILGHHATLISKLSFHISRVKVGGKMEPISRELTFKENQVLLLVGEEETAESVIELLGERSSDEIFLDSIDNRDRQTIVITNQEFFGKTLAESQIFARFGVIITRIKRQEHTFIPQSSTQLEHTDLLTVVGQPAAITAFATAAGHRAKALHETDLFSLAIGILTGIFAGMIPIALPGTEGFTLGLSGGPLLVALLLGHFGKIGKVVGRIPLAARNVLRELGLILFLAQAGISAGDNFIAVLNQYGVNLLILGALITTIPMIAGYIIARYFMKLGFLETLGGLSGGMTSTPALGTLTSKTDSEVPVVSYATAYPVSLVYIIIVVQILVHVS